MYITLTTEPSGMFLQEFTAMSPLMFAHPFTMEHLGKSSQWTTLTRAAAVAAVHDRIVEPWFDTFAGVHWRCNFLSESFQVRCGSRNPVSRHLVVMITTVRVLGL
jgi:hypothetical protein